MTVASHEARQALTEEPADSPFDAESPLYVAVRSVLFTGLVVVLGAVAFHWLVLGALRRRQSPESPMLDPARDRAASVGLWASLVVAVATGGQLAVQGFAMRGRVGPLETELMTAIVTGTSWGVGWSLQVAGALVAAVGFGLALRGARAGWPVATVGALLLAFTPALTGHAAAVPSAAPLAILADGLHVIGAGGWLGSLFLVVAVGIPVALHSPEASPGRAVTDLVNAFSPTALVFAALAAATGVFATCLHLDAVSALWETRYGLTLLAKLATLSIVAATGAYNWLRVKPALGTVQGAVRLRRSANVELAVGVLVLLVTAVLVATPTPVDMQGMSP